MTPQEPTRGAMISSGGRSGVSGNFDPNSAQALRLRSIELANAARPSLTSRVETLVELCAGRSVLDIGCVDHTVEGASAPTNLHRKISANASRSLGIDINAAGIAKLRSEGFSVEVADATLPPSEAVRAAGPFEVVVAGEVIEHLLDIGALFRFAAEVLAPEGLFVLTTPNPYVSTLPHPYKAQNVRKP